MAQNLDKYIEISADATKAVLDDFRKILPKMENKNIIDIGCGTGLLLEDYAKKNKATGIDSNQKSLDIASKKGIKTRLHDLEEKLPFSDSEFDLVLCKDLLEYIRNADQLVSEIARITKKDGLILLHVPNEFTIIDIINYALGKGIVKNRWMKTATELDNPHIRFFTKKSLKKCLEEKNLEIIADYSSKWSFRIPLISIKPRFLPLISDRLFSPGITLLCRKK